MSEANENVQSKVIQAVQPDGYDLAMQQMGKVPMCRACEEEPAFNGKYCSDCQRIDDALHWSFETKNVHRPFAVLPRVDGGIRILAEDGEMTRTFVDASPNPEMLASVLVMAGLALVGVGCLAWYGLRLLTELGIWVAR